VYATDLDRLLTQSTLLVMTLGPAYADAVDHLRTFVNQLRAKSSAIQADHSVVSANLVWGTASDQGFRTPLGWLAEFGRLVDLR
jgi:hypothetical protein